MTNAVEQPQRYFAAIDGLRLVASLNVALYHIESMGGLNDLGGAPGWLFRIIKGPAFHAGMFFVLGGFIFAVRRDKPGRPLSTGALLRARLRDLYPLHFVTTLVMLLLALFPLSGDSGLTPGRATVAVLLHLGLLWSFMPLGTHSLNAPSWALSAFFLCYALFVPCRRWVERVRRRRDVGLLLALCMLPAAGWSVLYAKLDNPDLYMFFHVFAPIRFFEFAAGILTARLFILNHSPRRRHQVSRYRGLNDLLIACCLVSLFASLHLRHASLFLSFFSYHVVSIPIFLTLVYRMARGNGLFCRLFSTALIRKLGKCSFYPYLLHLPLSALACRAAAVVFGDTRFLHSPLKLTILLMGLYGGSLVVWETVGGGRQRRRRLRSPVAAAAGEEATPGIAAEGTVVL